MSSHMHTYSYLDAIKELGQRDSRKIAYNTYLQKRPHDAVAILLHNTDVVTYYPDGHVVLYTGGWHTATTKSHINAATNLVHIGSINGSWVVWKSDDRDSNCYWYWETSYILPSGIKVHGVVVSPDGSILNCEPVMARVIQKRTSRVCETVADCLKAISEMSYQELKKIWRSAYVSKKVIIQHCQRDLLPLFMGQCTGQKVWEPIYRERMALGY